ncbi:hypothetical protein [Nocardia nova]
MALGTTGSGADVELLKKLALQPRSATTVNAALGDAIVRLGRDADNDPAPALWCLQQDVELLADGALRAVAMLRLKFPDSAVDAVLDHAEANFHDLNHKFLAYWPAVAAAGWSGPRVRMFLTRCSQDSREIIAAAHNGRPERLLRKLYERAVTGVVLELNGVRRLSRLCEDHMRSQIERRLGFRGAAVCTCEIDSREAGNNAENSLRHERDTGRLHRRAWRRHRLE